MRLTLFNVLMGVAAAALLYSSSPARAQAFLGGTPTAFTPQIGVVATGSVSDVQATVSADRKYVTLTMRPQLTTLLDLRSFTFQQGNAALGYVGMPATAAGNTATAAPVSPQTPWVSARPSVSILQRQGMIRVSKPVPATNPSPPSAAN